MRFHLGQNLAVFLLIAFFAAALNFFTPEIKGGVFNVFGPLQKTVWNTGSGISDFFRAVLNRTELQKQNEDLAAENENLRAELVRMETLEKENNELRKAADMEANDTMKLMMAEVAGRGMSADIFFLDKGAKDGIRSGMAVISAEKILYGIISEVYSSYSAARLLSHPDSSVNARVYDTDISGAVRGEGNGKLLLDLVPREKELKADSLIVTRPLVNDYPSGLIVGHNKTSEGSDVEPFQQASVVQSGAVEEHRFLFVITDF